MPPYGTEDKHDFCTLWRFFIAIQLKIRYSEPVKNFQEMTAMKKPIVLMLIILVLIVFVACGKDKSVADEKDINMIDEYPTSEKMEEARPLDPSIWENEKPFEDTQILESIENDINLDGVNEIVYICSKNDGTEANTLYVLDEKRGYIIPRFNMDEEYYKGKEDQIYEFDLDHVRFFGLSKLPPEYFTFNVEFWVEETNGDVEGSLALMYEDEEYLIYQSRVEPNLSSVLTPPSPNQ